MREAAKSLESGRHGPALPRTGLQRLWAAAHHRLPSALACPPHRLSLVMLLCLLRAWHPAGSGLVPLSRWQPLLLSAADDDILLNFKAGITNWEEAAASWPIPGWTRGVPICTWGGVDCSPYIAQGNRVTEL